MCKKFLMVCVSVFSILATALCAAQALDSDAAVGDTQALSMNGLSINGLSINNEGLPNPSELKENALKFKASLTEEQREQLKDVSLAAKPLAAEDMIKPPLDKKSVLGLAAKKIAAAARNPQKMEQAKEQLADIKAEIKAVLTPEQFAAYEAAFPPSPEEVANKLGKKEVSNVTPQAFSDCYNAELYNYYTYLYAYYSYAYAFNYWAAYGWSLDDLALDLYVQGYNAWLYSYYAYNNFPVGDYRTYANIGYLYAQYAEGTGYAALYYAYDPHYIRTGSSDAYYAYLYAYYAWIYANYGKINAYNCAYF